MEQFDQMIKEMAEKEEMIVPNGFDERLQDVLGSLPPKAKKGLGAAKIVLIAAAACAALLCTAFAASPELREALADALGSFAPYAQEQEDKTYTMDGFEVKVLSALTDGSTIRAYVQVKDLEGDRLSADMAPLGQVTVWSEADLNGEGHLNSYQVDTGNAVYDEESKTALLTFTCWAPSIIDLKDAKLEIRHIYDYPSHVEMKPVDPSSWEGEVHASEGVEIYPMEPVTPYVLNDVQLTIPLTVEAAPTRSFGPDAEIVSTFDAQSAQLSPLGLTMTLLYEKTISSGAEVLSTLFLNPVCVRMADGTEIDYEQRSWCMPTAQANYYNDAGEYCWVYFWNFPEALDLDQVEGISIGGQYFSLK